MEHVELMWNSCGTQVYTSPIAKTQACAEAVDVLVGQYIAAKLNVRHPVAVVDAIVRFITVHCCSML